MLFNFKDSQEYVGQLGGIKDIIIEDKSVQQIKENKSITNVKRLPDRVIFTALLQETDIPGGNRKIYPMDVLWPIIEANMDRIKGREFYGELDHPDIRTKTMSDREISDRIGKVKMSNASHIITDIWREGNKIYGTVETIPLHNSGKALTGIVSIGTPVGFSLRAIGDSKYDSSTGYIKVTSIRRLVAYDAVSSPSFKNAKLQQVMEEVYHTESSLHMEDNSIETYSYGLSAINKEYAWRKKLENMIK